MEPEDAGGIVTRILKTETPEKYPCANAGCENRAVMVEIRQTDTMPAPGFYGRCRDHGGCRTCSKPGMVPSHDGSRFCESGSIASGGKHAHCTCDTCF